MVKKKKATKKKVTKKAVGKSELKLKSIQSSYVIDNRGTKVLVRTTPAETSDEYHSIHLQEIGEDVNDIVWLVLDDEELKDFIKILQNCLIGKK